MQELHTILSTAATLLPLFWTNNSRALRIFSVYHKSNSGVTIPFYPPHLVWCRSEFQRANRTVDYEGLSVINLQHSGPDEGMRTPPPPPRIWFPPHCERLYCRVDYTGVSTINSQRFGRKFVGKVANPQDVLHWHKASAKRVNRVSL